MVSSLDHELKRNPTTDSNAGRDVPSNAPLERDTPALMSNSPPSQSNLDLDRKPTAASTSSSQNTDSMSIGPLEEAGGVSNAIHLSKTISRIPTATKPPSFSRAHEYIFVAVVISAQLFTQACLSISIAPLNYIGTSFHVDNAGKLSWLTAGFSLTVGTFILPAGRWGDLFGHKKVLIIGFAWLSIWSLVAGFSVWSGSVWFFALCRGFQGIGCAIMLPNGIAVLARTYPPGPRKDMVLSLFGATAPGGFVLGATFSGIFAELVWWPWVYWMLGMVVAAVGLAAVFVIPAMPVYGGRVAPLRDELDIIGTFIGVAGLVLFNFAWNQGPAEGWSTVYVYVLLIVGMALLVLFIVSERRWAKFPLLPSHAFTFDTNLVFACLSAGWASFGIWVFYYWQFLQVLEGNSTLLIVAKQCPCAISGALAAIATGFLISKIQPGFIMMISMLAFCTGTILMATNPVGRSYWCQIFVSTVVITLGMDMSFPSSVIILSNHMPPEEQGVAASLVNTVINYSISIGLGMAGTVENHVNKGGKDILAGYRGAWYLGIGLDGLGICLALCLILSWRATAKSKEKAELAASQPEKEEA